MIRNNKNFNQSLSGAKFSIIEKNNKLYFKKIISFKSIHNKKRILNSVFKQNFFEISPLPNPFFTIKASSLVKKNKIHIEMPFVHGFSGNEIIMHSQKNNINSLINIFSKLIEFFKNSKIENNNISKYKIEKKIIEIEKINPNGQYTNAIKYLERKLSNLDTNVYETLCHGDLTFSNIIITQGSNFKIDYNNNKILLIDWLDTYFDSYLQDLAKLKQELLYGWSSRKISVTQKINNLVTGEYIWHKIYNIFINDENRSLFKIVMILCILRILPYAKSENDINWIKEVIEMELKN